MKATVIALSILFATATAAELPVSSLEFAGYLSVGPERLFVLVDPATKERSSWMKLGERWHGYRPISFDPQRGMLVVTKDAETLQLTLRSARATEGGSFPRLLRGSFSVLGDTIVYSADAEISVRPKSTVRAFSGAMTYNSIEGTIRGDLVIDHSSHPMLVVAKGGVMKLKDGIVTASTMEVHKRTNKTPEPTP